MHRDSMKTLSATKRADLAGKGVPGSLEAPRSVTSVSKGLLNPAGLYETFISSLPPTTEMV